MARAGKNKNRRQARLGGGRTHRSFPSGEDRTGKELFQVVLSQVNREIGDERGAAPPGARASWINRRASDAARGVVAGKGVAIALAQVSIEVAQVKRELLPRKCDANVPGGVALVGDSP